MTTFKPLAPSLGAGFASPDDDHDAGDAPAPNPEPDMADKSIRDRILKAIKDAGGSINSHDLSEALDDIPVANRRYHAQQLAKKGLLSTTGTTTNRIYSLPGVKPRGDRTPRTSPRKPVSKTRPQQCSDAPTGSEAPLLPAIGRTHLNRLLVLALRSTGDLTRQDRDALAAVAEAW